MCVLFSGGLVLLSRVLGRCFLSFVSMSLPVVACDKRRVAWATPISLTRFVRVVRHGSWLGPRADGGRAALVVWLQELDLSAPRAEDDPSLRSGDEAMLG